ncbi:MAG: hypothetical protein ACR5LF_12820 [Symbiopectobacterium sp.]
MDAGHDFYAPQSFVTTMDSACCSAGWICRSPRNPLRPTAGPDASRCRANCRWMRKGASE